MKKIRWFSFLFLLACLPACSSYQYYAIQSNNARFTYYRTFAWLPSPDTSRYYNDIVDEKIKDAATAGLEKRGLVLSTGRPDLLVRYTVQVSERIRILNSPSYVYGPGVIYHGVTHNRYGRNFYYSYSDPFPVYVGQDIEQIPYKEGTLVIDLVERRNHRVIWRGYGTGDVDDRQKAIGDIPQVVEGILNKLPISPKVKSGN